MSGSVKELVRVKKGKTEANIDPQPSPALPKGYEHLFRGIAESLEVGQSQAPWSLDAVRSAVYWDIGRQIVELEKTQAPVDPGNRLVDLLAQDLHSRFGRGFRKSNLYQFRKFYLTYPEIFEIPFGNSGELYIINKIRSASGKSSFLAKLSKSFPLHWSHYVLLLSLNNERARSFYQTEAIHRGWSFRVLKQKIIEKLYENFKTK